MPYLRLHKASAAFIFALPRWKKRVLMVAADILMLAFAVWLGYAIRLGEWYPQLGDGMWLMLLAPVISIPFFIHLGLYRAVIRYIGSQALITVGKGAFFSTLVMAVLVALLHLQGIPRSVLFIYFGLAFLLLGGSRYMVRYWHYFVLHRSSASQPVIIYGAGQAGMQLASALGRGREFSPALFVDDNPALHRSVIQGLQVYAPAELPELVQRFGIGHILLAMPAADQTRRAHILTRLEHLPVHVRSIPAASDLVSGRSAIEDLHDIDIGELLWRAPVPPDIERIQQFLVGKVVMVTGAGGSIGSELCRQIVAQNPSKLILFENSELALYQIERELVDKWTGSSTKDHLIPVLGSVQNSARLEQTLREHQIQIVFHAAAYKHVPLVEYNPIEGIQNNSFGTLTAARAAKAAGVERFVLISTDKAVRPTNVMGASKRLAEMTLQALAKEEGATVFAMVRFGNVLGSSGSVVPLFQQQIAAGGPVTVTHPDVIRYFMSIPEAAQLVLQAGAMAKGGEIFLLDMGDPVKIVDLAKRLIKLSGHRAVETPQPGGIVIEFSGLRPGEKLFEELLISGGQKTSLHPQILQADDGCPPWNELSGELKLLQEACDKSDISAIHQILMNRVEGCRLTLPASVLKKGD